MVSFVGAGTINATPNSGRLTIALKPVRERDPAPVVIARLRAAIAGIPGFTAFFQPVQDITIGTRLSRTAFQYTLMDTDAAELARWAPRLREAMARSPALADVASDQENEGFRTFITVDRDAAMRLGVSMQAVEDTLYDGSASGRSPPFSARPTSIAWCWKPIRPGRPIRCAAPAAGAGGRCRTTRRRPPPSRRNRSSRPTVAATAQVPLSAIATITRTIAPLVVTHQEQFPSATLSFNLAPGYSLGDAVEAVKRATQAIGMPETIIGSYAGDAAEFQRSLAAEPWLIGAAVVVIYIVLGVLYESWIHPVTILSTLPSAGIGALLALMLCGADLSLVALVGIVLLMGIVKKNAIMMVDFALEAGRAGETPEAAIRRRLPAALPPDHDDDDGGTARRAAAGAGARRRLRTALAARGDDRRRTAAVQFLTLYTTPAVYLAFERLTARWGSRDAQEAAAE